MTFSSHMICLSISHHRVTGLLRRIESFAKKADILEIRLDLLSDPQEIDFEKLFSLAHPPLIFTNRKKDEGGSFLGNEEKRIRLLEKAAASGANFIDIEYSTRHDLRRRLIDKAHHHGTKVIVSFHDFDSTPDSTEIEMLFDNMANTGADIIKIVTMASDPLDFLKLMPVFIRSRQAAIPLIAFCMGEKGRYSRIFSLFLGGFLTFASADPSSQTAPGQIPLETVKQTIALLQKGK